MFSYEGGKVSIRRSTLHDICQIKDWLRDEDKAEIWAAMHNTPETDLLICYLRSTMCFTVRYCEIPAAMFGLAPETMVGERAVVWLLGTKEIERMKHAFARLSRQIVRKMLDLYPVLYNRVDARYKDAIKWIRWCGAEIDPPEPYGPDKMPFHRFVIERGA